MNITGVSLPLLVRDWIQKRCGHCFFIKEYYDIVWDPTKNVEEKVLGTLVAVDRENNYIVDVTLTSCTIDRWVALPMPHGPNGTFMKTLGGPVTEQLDWKSPNFFRKLGRIMKCRCKKS